MKSVEETSDKPITSTKQQHTTKSIRHYFHSTNEGVITPKRPSTQLNIPDNRSIPHPPRKTQQILQQPSAVRLPTKISSLIKNILKATKQKLKTIKKIYSKERNIKPIYLIHHQNHHQV